MTSGPVKILIIDDDFDLPFLLENALRRRGDFEVIKATRGDVGYMKFAASKPDVVLTDYYMPGLSGGELVAKITASEHKVPVIVMSGDAKLTTEKHLENVFRVLHKPFLVADLVKVILEAVNPEAPASP